MGELQHGIYDDDECEGLMYNEINALYGFDEEGGLVDEEYSSFDKSDNETEEGLYDEISKDSEIDIKVCFS